MRQEIEDNMELIRLIDDDELLHDLRAYSNQQVFADIEAAIKDATKECKDPEFKSACGKALQMMT